jgi:hypothetical protein
MPLLPLFKHGIIAHDPYKYEADITNKSHPTEKY